MQFWFEENGKVVDWEQDRVIGSCRVMGKTTKTNPITGQEYPDVDVVLVTLESGQQIQCTRLGPDYCLVPVPSAPRVIVDLQTGKENRIN